MLYGLALIHVGNTKPFVCGAQFQAEKNVVRRIFIVCLLICIVLVGCAAWRASPQATVYELVAKLTLAFEARVVRLRATAFTGITPTSHTIVAEVSEVFRGPSAMKVRTGKAVTILAKDLSGLKQGAIMVFFANAWVLGEQIAVQEVGRIARYERASLRDQISVAAEREAIRPIRENLRQASLVIVGRVAKVRDPERPTAIPPIPRVLSEHDPRFREAIVQVETVLKGQPNGETITLIFPSSRDVAWYMVPKFEVEQQGIWILKYEPKVERYLVTKPQDFLQRKRLEEVRGLLAQEG